MNAKLEQRIGQRPLLIVYYDVNLRNWDEAIKDAMAAYGLINATIIAKPLVAEMVTIRRQKKDKNESQKTNSGIGK